MWDGAVLAEEEGAMGLRAEDSVGEVVRLGVAGADEGEDDGAGGRHA